MGGKIPRKIKDKVISEWIQGLSRLTIARNNGISEGSVTNIIKEASLQGEYHDIAFLRQLALDIKEYGLEPLDLGFARRLKKLVAEVEMNVDQVERYLLDIAAYSYKHKLPIDTIILAGYEALLLEGKFNIPVEKMSEKITELRRDLEELVNETLKQIRKLQDARIEYDKVIANENKYRKEHQIREPENRLAESVEDLSNINLQRKQRERDHEFLRSEGEKAIEHFKWMLSPQH